MGVIREVTEADKARDGAISSIDEAIEYLAKIIIDKCYGHDDWMDSYRIVLQETFFDLIKARNKLRLGK